LTGSPPLVVSGLGVIGPFGVGSDALLAGLGRGEPRLVEVDRSGAFHRPGGARLAAPVAGDFSHLISPGAARRMSPPARLSVAAARLALADAGLGDDCDHARTGIVTGTAYGPTWVTERLLEQIFGQGPEAASPALFTESVANASAAQIALTLRARGPSATITQREASDVVALAEAARLVRRGHAERVLVGVVEDQVPILHALLDRFGALAHAADGLDERPRPFDRRRNGLLLAEGAVALLVETEASARARGARFRARLLGAGSAFDPSAPAWNWGDGASTLASALGAIVARAGLDPSSIDLVVSGASGARRGDLLEGETLRRFFAGRTPPALIAPKGTTGEYGGGALATAILAASGERLGGTAGFAEPDPEIGISPRTAPPDTAPGVVLHTALAAGGAAAWALFGAGGEPRDAVGV
jgi:3-oxoacyl-[acyl-carrier-protein] synthase II